MGGEDYAVIRLEEKDQYRRRIRRSLLKVGGWFLIVWGLIELGLGTYWTCLRDQQSLATAIITVGSFLAFVGIGMLLVRALFFRKSTNDSPAKTG